MNLKPFLNSPDEITSIFYRNFTRKSNKTDSNFSVPWRNIFMQPTPAAAGLFVAANPGAVYDPCSGNTEFRMFLSAAFGPPLHFIAPTQLCMKRNASTLWKNFFCAADCRFMKCSCPNVIDKKEWAGTVVFSFKGSNRTCQDDKYLQSVLQSCLSESIAGLHLLENNPWYQCWAAAKKLLVFACVSAIVFVYITFNARRWR